MARRKPKAPPPRPGWATYLRTSDKEAQNPHLSQQRQRMAIKNLLMPRFDLPMIDEYIDNLTGKTPNRTDYQRLIEDAKAGKFSHIAVERPDRFGRNDTEALQIIDELHQYGVAVRFADQPELDPIHPDDRIMVSLKFTLARRESLLMGERIQGGLNTKMHEGGFVSLAPDGYKNMEERKKRKSGQMSGRYRHWVEPDPEQFKVWREAWDMLLEDRLSLDEICEALHARGYHRRSGAPFVWMTNGERKYAKPVLSKKFHNWFYAGWVVSEAAGIPPKTIRGEWTPLVTTEEFERGLAILASRRQERAPRRRHNYLLSRLIYLQLPGEHQQRRLTCSTSNPERANGGTPYYGIAGTSHSFMCKHIDPQLADWLMRMQVDPAYVPAIRAAYKRDVANQLGQANPSEKTRIQAELKAIDTEEERTLRLYATGRINEKAWNSLWTEWQDRRRILRETQDSLTDKIEVHVEHLDQALTLISEVGVLFNQMALSERKALLKEIVDRVVIDPSGEVIKVDLQPPFSYLRTLSEDTQAQRSRPRRSKAAGKTKTSGDSAAGSCSNDVSSGGPEGLRLVS